jgi:hypothetical protein
VGTPLPRDSRLFAILCHPNTTSFSEGYDSRHAGFRAPVSKLEIQLRSDAPARFRVGLRNPEERRADRVSGGQGPGAAQATGAKMPCQKAFLDVGSYRMAMAAGSLAARRYCSAVRIDGGERVCAGGKAGANAGKREPSGRPPAFHLTRNRFHRDNKGRATGGFAATPGSSLPRAMDVIFVRAIFLHGDRQANIQDKLVLNSGGSRTEGFPVAGRAERIA